MTHTRFTNIGLEHTLKIFYRTDLYPDWEFIEVPPGTVASVNGSGLEFKVADHPKDLRVDSYSN